MVISDGRNFTVFPRFGIRVKLIAKSKQKVKKEAEIMGMSIKEMGLEHYKPIKFSVVEWAISRAFKHYSPINAFFGRRR